MRHSKLSALLVAAALAGAPTASAFADSAPVAETFVAADAPAVSADAARYAAREAKDPAVADFKGGRNNVVVIGGSTLVIVLLVVLIVLLL